jgi:hypothetical protein
MHEVAGAKARREERAREPPIIGLVSLGLIQRTEADPESVPVRDGNFRLGRGPILPSENRARYFTY